MRRIGWKWSLLVLLPLSSPIPPTRAEDPPIPAQSALPDIDEILDQWQKRMASVSSIEAKFRGSSDELLEAGRSSEWLIVLASPDLMLFEGPNLDADNKPLPGRSKVIWTGEQILVFDDRNNHVVRISPLTDRAHPPAFHTMPFLFRCSVEQAKERYDWETLGENRDQILLSATLRPGKGTALHPQKCHIWLNRTTYLPDKFSIRDYGLPTKTFKLTEVKINGPVDEDLKTPCLDAWRVIDTGEWFSRLLLR